MDRVTLEGPMHPKEIEIFAALSFLAIGLSHLLQPQAWVEYFVRLRDQGPSGAFTEGFLCLTFGSLIVSFHNVWSGLPAVLTVIGWAQVAKGLVRFVAPQVSLKGYQRIGSEQAWKFRAGGVFSLALAAFLGYLVLR
jgi:uncharacterized protein YjeT (DUF2065 family)